MRKLLIAHLEQASNLANPLLLSCRPSSVVISTLGRNLAVPVTLGQAVTPTERFLLPLEMTKETPDSSSRTSLQLSHAPPVVMSPFTRNDRMGFLLGQLEQACNLVPPLRWS